MKHTKKHRIWDTIIVGAGAAGMAAAIACKNQGQKVLLIDKQSQMAERFLLQVMESAILLTLHKKKNIIGVIVPEERRKYCLCLGKEKQWNCSKVLEFIQRIRMGMFIRIVNRRQA